MIDSDEDTVSETSSEVIEFELLSHNLLNNHEHHVTLFTEDHQYLPNNFINNEDSVYDPDDCSYNLETLDVILSDYEELYRNFDFFIISSTFLSATYNF